MESTSIKEINEIVVKQKNFFSTGATLSYDFRRHQLKVLLNALEIWEGALCEALWMDLHKSQEEAILTELSIVKGEARNHLSHLKRWMKPAYRRTPLKMFPSSSRIISEPLGTALIIAPWNYPVQLLLNPLIGAIAAGCTAVLKPSPYVPTVSTVLVKMIRSCFKEDYIAICQGHRDVNTALLEQRFDLIFLTGSPSLGRKVMEAAAKHLTPVVLELGGKSPCIVDRDANIRVAARRIAWGKTLNAGQTCIAPDYLLIHTSIQEEFVKAFQEELHQMFGEKIQESKYYVRMVNDKAFERVVSYLKEGTIVAGGHTDSQERYIEPTLMTNVASDARVMQEEIFGPVFPIIPFTDIEEAVRLVNKREKPLALYYFGQVKKGNDVIRRTSSGGACINDTIMHIANEKVPFGGVGNSGMGQYHGKLSFDAFSHQRAVVVTPSWIDLPFRYVPYKMFKWMKKIL